MGNPDPTDMITQKSTESHLEPRTSPYIYGRILSNLGQNPLRDGRIGL